MRPSETAERERRTERRVQENVRFEAWEQWYYDQIKMMEAEKAEEEAKNTLWEKERQTQLREMERTVRKALVEQLGRIRQDIRATDGRYTASLSTRQTWTALQYDGLDRLGLWLIRYTANLEMAEDSSYFARSPPKPIRAMHTTNVPQVGQVPAAYAVRASHNTDYPPTKWP